MAADPKNFHDVQWASWLALDRLSVGQAVQLMVGVDPNYSKKWITNPSTHPELQYAQKIFKYAVDQGIRSMSPANWMTWTTQHRIKIHPVFSIKLMELNRPKPENTELTPVQAT